MAALRERYPARDGMGHANRSRFDYIVCVDTQPRGVRLSTSRWWGESNADSDRKSYSYTDSDSYGNSNPHGDCHGHCDGNSDADTETYTDTEDCTDAEAASYAATSPIEMVIRDE